MEHTATIVGLSWLFAPTLDILPDRMVNSAVVAELKFSDNHIWIPTVVTVSVWVLCFVFAWSHKAVIFRKSYRPYWRGVFAWGAGVSAIFMTIFSASVDIKDIFDNKFPDHYFWTGPWLISSYTLELFFLGVNYFKSAEEIKEQKGIERLASVLERHEQRRELIGEIVNHKAQSVRAARVEMVENASVLPPEKLIEVFQPKDQMLLNFVALHKSIRKLIGRSGSLRIAVFLPSDDFKSLKLLLAFDGKNHNCITTPNKAHAERFRLPTDDEQGDPEKARKRKPCLAVHAATEAGLHVIPNTGRPSASDKKKFSYLDEKQRTVIKSIAAYGYVERDDRPHAVIVADSDRKSAFKNDDESIKLLETEFQEFGSRLLFEADVLTILGPAQGK